jgi:hypothetical protein
MNKPSNKFDLKENKDNNKFIPSEKFLNTNVNMNEKISDVNKSMPYYPLPSNDGYEKFLQTMKKDQCNYF